MASPETKRIQKRSGPQDSGKWAEFSQWYSLCSDPLPVGFRIVSHHFLLEGDRQCGAWAECRQTYSGSEKVCYEFRMQGHNEGLLGIGNPNEGRRQSEGVLSIEVSNA